MLLIWTSVAKKADAERLANDAITLGLAACVQIDGPLLSVYRWKGQVERDEEFRLCFKCLPQQLSALEQHVLAHHPYKTPEWLVVRAEQVGEKYLSWAEANSTNPPPLTRRNHLL